MINSRSLNLLVAAVSHFSVDHYAKKYKGEKTPSLFSDDDKPSWVKQGEWDESKHPRVEKGSKDEHGGQFTSVKQQSLSGLTMADAVGKIGDKKEDRKKPDGIESNEKLPLFDQAAKVLEESAKKPETSPPEKPDNSPKPIPFRDRNKFASDMLKAGKSKEEIESAMVSRGVAISDARMHASKAIDDQAQSAGEFAGAKNPNSAQQKIDAAISVSKQGVETRAGNEAWSNSTLGKKTLNEENKYLKYKERGQGKEAAESLQEFYDDNNVPMDRRLKEFRSQAKQESPGIVIPSKTVPNDQAKPGDQLGLFGEATKEAKPSSKPADEPKAKQGGLFDTKGNPDQMDLFGGGGIPDDMVYKPDAKKEPVSTPKPIPISNKDDLSKAFSDAIADFGEKIGGARKDTAVPLGSRPKKQADPEKDSQPAWRRKYEAIQDSKTGKWFVAKGQMIQDPSNASIMNRIFGRRDEMFDSKEAAEADIPLIEVKRNHGISYRGKVDEKQNWSIYRKVTDKKLPTVKSGFETRDAAEKYLKENAESIIEHKFPDWEDYSYLDHVDRKGKEHRPGGKDVKPKDFQETFNFRGGEFGKWQMNQDGQTSLNHAFDGLHDLAETIGLPARAMSLNGKLAIAFGSRGTGGKHSAKAHYEPDKEVINLTKMKGAGSLAHEWFHALDHYMAQQVHGPERNGKKTESLLSERLPYGAEHKGRQEVVDAWKNLVNTMNSKTVDEKIQGDDKKLSQAKKTVSEVVDQLDEMIESNKRYNKRHKGLNEEQKKEWDAAKEKIKNLDVGSKTSIASLTNPDSKVWNSPSTFAPLQKLNELYKKATGRSFHTGDRNHGERIYWSIWRAQQEAEKIARGSEGETASRKRSTQFLDDSHALDKFRTGQYYAKDIEMAARAFQGYVYDKTEGVGKPSQYLNGKAHNKHYTGLMTEDGEPFRPFPGGEERENINAAFDKLFKAIKTKDREDDKGKHVELYSSNLAREHYAKYRGEKTPSLFADEDKGPSWITIGGKSGGDGAKHVGGHPVQISDEGKMLTGRFAGMSLADAFGKENKKPDGQQEHRRHAIGTFGMKLRKPKQPRMFPGTEGYLRALNEFRPSSFEYSDPDRKEKEKKSRAILDNAKLYVDPSHMSMLENIHEANFPSGVSGYKYSWDDLAYDESVCDLANDLYSALSVFSVDHYYHAGGNWNEQLHPRGEKGNANGGQFTSKGNSGGASVASVKSNPPVSPSPANRSIVREIADHPILQRHHSLHIGNQDTSTKLQVSDYSKQYTNLITRASRISDSQDEETIWKNVDKVALRKLLAQTNDADRKRKANGQTGLDSLFNANQVIPKMIAKRLSSGSRFFDPEKLRGKWNEPSPKTDQTQAQQAPQSPQAAPEAPAQAKSEPSQSPQVEAQPQAEETPQDAGQPEMAQPATQSEPEPQPQPAKARRAPINPDAMAGVFGEKLPEGISKAMNTKLERRIKASIGNDPEIVKAFKPIVFQAWKELTQQANDHNQAIRQVTNTAASLYDSSHKDSKSVSAPPQKLTALIREARSGKMDPSQKKGFDLMVDNAQRNFPQYLAGRGEDGFIDWLTEGVKPQPNLLDAEVGERAMTLAGADFFRQFEQGEAPEQDEPQTSDDDWNDQFSWHKIFAEHYAMFAEHYAGKDQMTFNWDEDSHPREPKGADGSKGGEFTKKVSATQAVKPKATPTLKDGYVLQPRAKAGGEVSSVDGKLYKGGALMPVHGMFSGMEKPPAKEKRSDGTSPIAKENQEPRQIRQRSSHEVEAERERMEEQRKWDILQAGPISDLFGWIGDRPNFKAFKGSPGHKFWAPFAERLGTDGVEKLAKFMKEKTLSREPSSAYRNNVEWQINNDQHFHTKKHIKAVPNSRLGEIWLDEFIRESSLEDKLELNDKLKELLGSGKEKYSWKGNADHYACEPSKAQAEAGNYRMKHIRIQGLNISIETPRGKRRRPEWPPMAADYGYIKGTVGKDGDHLDVFVGPRPNSELVYVIDQPNKDGGFDEHKIMLGFVGMQNAIATYKRCYTPDWTVGPVTAMTIGQFKNWIASGRHKKPIERQVSKYSQGC